mmetsp:Transcript_20/g.48  ORF Transcript_20/g.48 Transcript_20/m.48 type:complete len:233 (-) Transcript_20:376-1074(-)
MQRRAVRAAAIPKRQRQKHLHCVHDPVGKQRVRVQVLPRALDVRNRDHRQHHNRARRAVEHVLQSDRLARASRQDLSQNDRQLVQHKHEHPKELRPQLPLAQRGVERDVARLVDDSAREHQLAAFPAAMAQLVVLAAEVRFLLLRVVLQKHGNQQRLRRGRHKHLRHRVRVLFSLLWLAVLRLQVAPGLLRVAVHGVMLASALLRSSAQAAQAALPVRLRRKAAHVCEQTPR